MKCRGKIQNVPTPPRMPFILKSDIEISRKDAKPQRIEKKLERICALISVSFTNWVNSFTLTISKKS